MWSNAFVYLVIFCLRINSLIYVSYAITNYIDESARETMQPATKGIKYFLNSFLFNMKINVTIAGITSPAGPLESTANTEGTKEITKSHLLPFNIQI